MPSWTTRDCSLRGAGHFWTDHRHIHWMGKEMIHPTKMGGDWRVDETDFLYVSTWRPVAPYLQFPLPAYPGIPGDWAEATRGSFIGLWGGRSITNIGGSHLYVVQVDGPVLWDASSTGAARKVDFLRGRIMTEIDLSPLDDPRLQEAAKATAWAASWPNIKSRKWKPFIHPDRHVAMARCRAEAKPLLERLDEIEALRDGYSVLRDQSGVWTATERNRIRRQLNNLRKFMLLYADIRLGRLQVDSRLLDPGPLRAFLERDQPA